MTQYPRAALGSRAHLFSFLFPCSPLLGESVSGSFAVKERDDLLGGDFGAIRVMCRGVAEWF